MSRQLQYRLRISIVFLSFLLFICNAVYFGVFVFPSVYWQIICALVTSFITFIFYIRSIRSHAITSKAVRAIPLLVIAGLWLYIPCDSLNILVTYAEPFFCEYMNFYCILQRTCIVLSIVSACSVITEVGVTLRLGPLVPVQPKEVIIASPLELQQQPFQQQQQQHYAHNAPHPGIIPYPYQQQPLQQYSQYPSQLPRQPGNGFVSGTPKYEDQSHLYQQQQYYHQQQPPPQQQPQQQPQQHQQQYVYQVPGSTVTATPQPGGQPIAPYPSPGTSVAVSPVLPVGGYPITSASPHTFG